MTAGGRAPSRGASAMRSRIRASSPNTALSASPMPETIRVLSGQHFVPIVVDADRVIHDSWNIACYLEDTFPDRPSLFRGAGAACAGARDQPLVRHQSWRRDPPADRCRLPAPDPGDHAYYRRSREAVFGCTLEEYCADRPRWRACSPPSPRRLEKTLAEQPHVTGAAPGYADYILFSVFQYAWPRLPGRVPRRGHGIAPLARWAGAGIRRVG